VVRVLLEHEAMRARSSLVWPALTVLGLVVGCSSSLTGGTGGTGGTPGTSATGGVPGTAGSSGACQALAAQYQMLLAGSQACAFDAGGACGQLALATLPPSGCPNWCDEVWVNDNSGLNALQQQWQEAGCQGPGECLYPPCPAPAAGQCGPGTGQQGICQTASRPGTGGTSGAGGSGPVACGNTTCTSSEFCCDPLCSVCSPIGSLCDQGCAIGADAGVGGTGVCASLAAEYARAIAVAQACTVGSAGCGAMVHGALAGSECGCDFIYVNDSTEADAIYQTWSSAGCEPKSTCVGVCAPPGQSGVCVATDGGASGVCQFAAPHGG